MFYRSSNQKTPIQLVADKLFMSFDGLHTHNSPRKIDHPKCTILAKDTIVLDIIFQNYSQEYLFEDIICENCSSGISESMNQHSLCS